ncbi:hypothetical protein HMPREF1142_0982 [Peptostreptococcaceae bacterium AS15]|nr:hypothetical protein HMPREF1142_0982 [Peptostreptococcaceae bacterium AS15]
MYFFICLFCSINIELFNALFLLISCTTKYIRNKLATIVLFALSKISPQHSNIKTATLLKNIIGINTNCSKPYLLGSSTWIKSEYGKSRYIKSIVHKMILAHFVLLIFNRLLTKSIRPITNILLILFSNPETITNATVIGLFLYIKAVY